MVFSDLVCALTAQSGGNEAGEGDFTRAANRHPSREIREMAKTKAWFREGVWRKGRCHLGNLEDRTPGGQEDEDSCLPVFLSSYG